MTYTNSRKETIPIGQHRDLHQMESDLHDYEWDYDPEMLDGPGFYRSAKERTLRLGMWCEDESTGIRKRNELYRVFEADILDGTPGTITSGEWAIECYVIRSVKGQWHIADHIMEIELTLLCPHPFWTRESLHQFFIDDTPITGDNLDYPRDYPYDYMPMAPTRTLIVDSQSACRFLLIVYGPAYNPAIAIGENLYQVYVALEAGDRLEVDTRTRKTVRVIRRTGEVYDAFSLRLRGAEGSGQYLFELLKPGPHPVMMDNSFGFDLITVEERSEPEWT